MSAVLVWAGVGVLGGLGALARFALDGAIGAPWGGRFPIGTLVVNISGAFLLGVLTGLAPPSDAMLLGGTALLGSYTTFSTWMLETNRAAEDGERLVGVANVVISLAAGLAAVAAGRALGRML